MQPTTLLPEILQNQAALDPDRRAYVYLDETGVEKDVLTYHDLHVRALAVAQELSLHCAPGDRALLVFRQSLDFIVAYFGCLYAQVIAVPVNPPRRNRPQQATYSIMRDCTPSAVLTVTTMMESLKSAVEPVLGAMHWLAVDQLTHETSETIDLKVISADSIAFLQYTSGSTSEPKGVMVSHGNLVANQEMIRRAFGHDQDSTVVGWAPFFHDQGLIGNVLQPLYVGTTSIVMSPMGFMRRPLQWLSAISQYRAHSSGGPNFAFDACIARAAASTVPDLDLSCWKVAFNGAEPIRAETLRRFTETFAPYGFSATTHYPCYGLAEATLLVTGSWKGRGARVIEADVAELRDKRYAPAPSGQGRTLVGAGVMFAPDDVRIVDPDSLNSCAPNEIGEIWVSGKHVTQGYWKRPMATTDTFRARCADGPDRAYLRTGDLGLLIDDELYVVGRIKDLVIIRGRNYYPQDLEQTAQASHPALQPGGTAAFSVTGPDGEKLVVVQEIARSHQDSADPAEVAGCIRDAVTREHELSINALVLILPGQLPKTSSGKIMRSAARKYHLAAEFKPWILPEPSIV
jgi:acyl-CoA synthetase (AMP-forming)/AMP-acid ligase II